MNNPLRRTLVMSCLLVVVTTATAADRTELPSGIFDYAARAEPVYEWSVVRTHTVRKGRAWHLRLVSQTWQDVVWEHDLIVCRPQRVVHPNHVLLFVTGGRNGRSPGPDELGLGLELANLCGAPVATLHQVPNQPLLDGRVEDDLITETWLKYLATGDETWPLLFPMVKSAQQAMNALQEFSLSEWQQPVAGFVITGGSKRGWTSWLTPVVDDRVIATAPLVIDTLNFPVQSQNQLEAWGAYSEQIADYTRKGLVKQPGDPLSEREERLWKMMDPYTYRSVLTLPKLIVNGTNDRYWTVDAVKFYWNDLAGPKYIRQVPNAGHGLDGGKQGALRTVAAFFRHAALDKPLPQLQWSHDVTQNQTALTVSTDTTPVAARLWTATSATHDFRESTWTSRDMQRESEKYVGAINRPPGRHVAVYGELEFHLQNLKYSLTTRVFQE